MVLSRAVLLGMNVQHLPPTLWDPDGIYVDMVRGGLVRVKGIANWTKVQVPLHLTRRVSSKGPLQYHQTSALVTEQTYCSSLQRIDLQRKLHPDAFPRNSSPCPQQERQEAKLELQDGSLIDSGGFSLSRSLITGSDKVLKDPLPQAVLSRKMAIVHAIPARSVVHPRGKETTSGSCRKCVAITFV
jgi:hypothetical protein